MRILITILFVFISASLFAQPLSDRSTTSDGRTGFYYVIKPSAGPTGFTGYRISYDNLTQYLQTEIDANESRIAEISDSVTIAYDTVFDAWTAIVAIQARNDNQSDSLVALYDTVRIHLDTLNLHESQIAAIQASLNNKMEVSDTINYADTSFTVKLADGFVLYNSTQLSANQPFDSISLNKNTPNPDFQEWTLKVDTTLNAIVAFTDESEITPRLIFDDFVTGKNETGSLIEKGTIVFLDSSSTHQYGKFNPAIGSNKEQSRGIIGMAAHDIEAGTIGYALREGDLSFPGHGITIGEPFYVSKDTAGKYVETRPIAPYYDVRIGRAINDSVLKIDANPFDATDTDVNMRGYLDGNVPKKPDVTYLIESGVVYMEVQNSVDSTENLPFLESGNLYFLNTTTNTGTGGRARVALESGIDSNDYVLNYGYIVLQGDTGALMSNTTGFPVNSAQVATAVLMDTSSTQNYGVLDNRDIDNAVTKDGSQGLLNEIIKRIRLNGVIWQNNVNPSLQIVDNGAALDSVQFSVTSGQVPLLHDEQFDALDHSEYYVLNDTAGIRRITDLNQITYDVNGNTFRNNNDYYAFNIVGLQSSSQDRFGILLPEGKYSTAANAINDINNFAVTNVPAEFRANAFRIARVVLEYENLNNTIKNPIGAGQFQDERGLPLGVGGGGSGTGSSSSNFSDTDFLLFDGADASKIGKFQLSSITTGTTRTLTWPDKNGTIMTLSDTSSLLSKSEYDTDNDGIVDTSDFANTSGQLYTDDLNEFHILITGSPYAEIDINDLLWNPTSSVMTIAGDAGDDPAYRVENSSGNQGNYEISSESGVNSYMSIYSNVNSPVFIGQKTNGWLEAYTDSIAINTTLVLSDGYEINGESDLGVWNRDSTEQYLLDSGVVVYFQPNLGVNYTPDTNTTTALETIREDTLFADTLQVGDIIEFHYIGERLTSNNLQFRFNWDGSSPNKGDMTFSSAGVYHLTLTVVLKSGASNVYFELETPGISTGSAHYKHEDTSFNINENTIMQFLIDGTASGDATLDASWYEIKRNN